jgi:hypothetical protein
MKPGIHRQALGRGHDDGDAGRLDAVESEGLL